MDVATNLASEVGDGREDAPRQCELFEREAGIIAALNPPNICVLHDVGHGAVEIHCRVRFEKL